MNTSNKPNVLTIKKHENSTNPKVSVIVPVFKVERYLVQCLNSIVNQTLEDIEIIIVDEGLHDRCREIIDYFEAHDPRIVAPHQNNGGYGASCNLGFQLAKGEYIAIVESDDYIEPNMYEEMYNYAKQLDADVVKTPYKEFYADGTKKDCNYRKYMQEVTPSGKCFSMKEFGEMLCIHASLWAAIYKTEYIKKNNIQFIKAKGGAYVDVGFRIDTLINTDKIAWLDKPYYNYRVDSEGSTTNNFNLSKMIERWQEAHNKFQSIQEDYNKYYGKFLILDEYLNTVGWLRSIKATPEDIAKIADNMANVPNEIIETSPVLEEYQKKDLLNFKENPHQYVQKIKTRNFFKKILNYCLNLMLRMAKTWHLIIPAILLFVSLAMENYFTGILSTIFHYSVILWLIIIGIYTLNICIYELFYVTIVIKRKRTNKKDKDNG